MDNARTGKLIYELRKEKALTQKQLADKLMISDKAVSKWERGLGCPDISLLSELASIFGINVEQLLYGGLSQNDFVGGNMKKANFYVCSVCGNVSVCTGNGEVSCCSRKLDALTAVKPDEAHDIKVSEIEDEWFIESNHPMLKEHYISFIAFTTGDRLEIIKQYPEWNLQTRIPKRCHGRLLWYCTQNGLFYKNI